MTLSVGQANIIKQEIETISLGYEGCEDGITLVLFPNFIHSTYPEVNLLDQNSLCSLRIPNLQDLNHLSAIFKIAANHGANNYLIHSGYIFFY